MSSGVSRSGSTETKKALRRFASPPITRRISDISNSAVGQTSGQWVKPKKMIVGLPCRFLSLTVWPA